MLRGPQHTSQTTCRQRPVMQPNPMPTPTAPDLPAKQDHISVTEIIPPALNQRHRRSAAIHPHGLTDKQEAFCVASTHGNMNLSDAFRTAYDTSNMTPQTIWTSACQLAGNPKVRLRREELIKELPQDAGAIYAEALGNLRREAITARSDGARIAASKAIFDRFDAAKESAKLVAVGSSLRIELTKRLDALLPSRALGKDEKK